MYYIGKRVKGLLGTMIFMAALGTNVYAESSYREEMKRYEQALYNPHEYKTSVIEAEDKRKKKNGRKKSGVSRNCKVLQNVRSVVLYIFQQ